MIKALLIDDEFKSLMLLRKLIQDHCKDVSVVGQVQRQDDAFRLIEHFNPDVVFLDIELADGSGFDLLGRTIDRPFHTIFVTAHDQYALRAFKYSATDYIMKPVDVDDLKAAVEKVQRQIVASKQTAEQSIQGYFRLKTSRGFMLVPLSDLIRCEAVGNYTKVYLKNHSVHVLSNPIGEIAERLDKEVFFRCHKSNIINLKEIVEFAYLKVSKVSMSDGSKVEVSRRNRRLLLARLNPMLD